jgi:cell division inhibitor SepF
MNDELGDPRSGNKNFLHKLGSIFAIHEDEDDALDLYEDEAVQPKRNVVAFSAREPRRGSAAGEVSVFAPRAFADVTEIADALRARQVVIVNLQGVDRGLLQRVVDFTSGVAYTLEGKIQKLADAMYLIVPPGTPVNSAGIRETLGADPSFDFMTTRG